MSNEKRYTRVRWSLLADWWCVPLDISVGETEDFISTIREQMGGDFSRCPDEQIVDRLFGGFACVDADKRHVCFSTGDYSYLSAADGYFPPHDSRCATWAKLVDASRDTWVGDGPFANDVPEAIAKATIRKAEEGSEG